MSKTRRSRLKGEQPKRIRALVAALTIIALLYAALLPRLRSIQAETDRINREVNLRNAAISHTTAAIEPIEAARAAVAKSPDDIRANLTLIGALAAAGKPDEALGYAKNCASRNPDNVEASLALADIYERLRRHYEAMEIYREVLKRSPGTLAAINRLSWMYISYGWTADARALLEPTVKSNLDDPHVQVELALTYLQTHDFQRCEQILLKIRRDHPAEPELWNPLVDLYLKRKLYPQAIEVLRDSLKLRPGDPALTDSLADAYFQSGDVSRAQSTWQSNLAASPSDIAAHFGLAECHRKTGKTSEAVSELEAVMRLDPSYKESKLLLGQLYLRNGRAADGARLLREFQEEQARSREYARLSLLLASKTHDPNVHFEMARHYASAGKPERATVELHRALELDPNLPDARKMLAGLEQSGR